MKYLISNDFVAIRKGEFVKATGSGEFVYDTENSKLSISQLKEIAMANKISTKGSKKEEVKDELDTGLEQKDIPAQNEKTLSDKVLDIVRAGHEAEPQETDDELLIKIVQAGVKFQVAMKELKAARQALGLEISPKDRFEKVQEVLGKDFRPETWEDVQKTAEFLVKKVENTNEAQAISALKRYAKENEFKLPQRPKREKGEKGQGGGWAGPETKRLDWIINNPNGTIEEMAKVFHDTIKKPDLFNKRYSRMMEFANRARQAMTQQED